MPKIPFRAAVLAAGAFALSHFWAPTAEAGLSQPGGMLDIGKVAEGEVKEFSLAVRNDGEEAVRIDRLEAGCHCTRTGALPDSIGPGETVQLPVAFDATGVDGELQRTVSIYADGNPEAVLTAVYKVFIEPRFAAKPETVEFSRIAPMTFAERSFTVERVKGDGVLKDVVVNDERLFARAKRAGEGRWKVTVYTSPEAKAGSFMAIVTVKLTDPLREELAVLATGEFE